jgi:UDP-glucose 4-epimerase
MKKYLVLGGSGFIGRKIVEKLSVNNHIVVGDIIDNFCGDNINVEYKYIDFVNTDNFSPFLRGIDEVIHLVSTNIPCESTENFSKEISENVLATIYLLESMKKEHINKITFISSGGTIYGEGKDFPIKETEDKSPICKYAAIKLFIENIINLYKRYDNIEFLILRLSNPYGYCEKFKRTQGIIPIFIDNIINNTVTTIWGDGNNIRDYIYIDDAIEAIDKLLAKESTVGTYNIGTGIGTSINKIIEIIISNTGGCKENIIYKPSRKCDVKKNILDISKIKEEIQWEAKCSVELGIKIMIEQYNQRIACYD